MSKVKIISANEFSEEICASAGRISTTAGTSLSLFENAKTNTKNADLIRKVTSSGHTSVLEHAVFTLAFEDVSMIVEQFMIEHRLASFTVKSRRYVDFSNLGYYIPTELLKDENAEDYAEYCKIMTYLFTQYQVLLDNGANKEDARFLLPFSFHSNFYCTLNARELQHVIFKMKYGYGHNKPEFQELADQLIGQLSADYPWAVPTASTENPRDYADLNEFWDEDAFDKSEPEFIDHAICGTAKIEDSCGNQESLLNTFYQWRHGYDQHMGDERDERIEYLMNSECARGLELIHYIFSIRYVSLPALTHLTRHRMQTLDIPVIDGIRRHRYILPESFKVNPALNIEYTDTLRTAYAMIKDAIERRPLLKKYHYYFILSANLIDVTMGVNARELLHMIKLRTCSRAQWEVQHIFRNILAAARADMPKLFNEFGPSCYVTGHCPEGKLTCGNRAGMISTFKPDYFKV